MKGRHILTCFFVLSFSQQMIALTQPKNDCSVVNSLRNRSEQCRYVKMTPDCMQHDSGFVDYIIFVYCRLNDGVSQAFGFIMLCLWLCYLLFSMGLTSNKFFAPNLPIIADALHMSENVAGETLLALGNGAPDFFTSLVVALKMDDTDDLGFLYGELLGSGMFVTTVIIGVVVTVKPFRTMERALLRDIIFYMAAIYCAFATVWDGVLYLQETMSFLVIYACYLASIICAGPANRLFDMFVSKWAVRQPQIQPSPSALEQRHIETGPPAVNEPTAPEAQHIILLRVGPVPSLPLPNGNGGVTTTSTGECESRMVSSSLPESLVQTMKATNDDENDDENSNMTIPKTTETAGPSCSQAADDNQEAPPISVTRSSRAVMVAAARLRRHRHPRLKATKSQSMKVTPAVRDRLETERRMSRQLSMMAPKTKNRLEPPMTREQQQLKKLYEEEEHDLERASSIPHAARLMVRSASSKEKSAQLAKTNLQKEDESLLGRRNNSTPCRRQIAHQQPAESSNMVPVVQPASVTTTANEYRPRQLLAPSSDSENVVIAERARAPVTSSPVQISITNEIGTSMAANNTMEVGNSPTTVVAKPIWEMLFEGINPIKVSKLRAQPWYRNFLHLARAPFLFIMLLTNPVVNEDKPMFNWNRPLNVLHCVVSPTFFIFIIFRRSSKVGGLSAPVIGTIFGALLAATVCCSSKNNERPRYHVVFAFFGFLTAIMWIYILASEVVNVLECFGIALNISRPMLGLTWLAWGNSLADLINDATLAKQGFQKMAIGACYGGMLFNLLLGLGLPLTIAAVRHKGVLRVKCSSIMTVLFGFLALNIAVSFVVIPLVQNFYLKRPFAIYLFCFYGCFLVCAILTEAGVINVSMFPSVDR